MSLSFKTVAKVESPAVGNLRVATDEVGKSYYKFIGDKALTLEEIVLVLTQVSFQFTVGEEPIEVEAKRSGYKYKTTWTV